MVSVVPFDFPAVFTAKGSGSYDVLALSASRIAS